MSRYGYTPEQKAFIEQNAPGLTLKELTDRFNAHFNLTYKKGRLVSYCYRRKIPYLLEMHRLTVEQKAFIKQNSSGTPYKELAEKFNDRFGLAHTQTQLINYCKALNCQNGNDSRFKPGHDPIFSPKQTAAIGTERLRNGYVEVKTAPSTWRSKHAVVWESIHGPIPPKHNVIFGNGDRNDFTPDNLVLIPRKNLPVMNSHGLIGGSAELTRTGKIVSDVYLAISARKKGAAKRSRKERSA